MSNIFKSSKVLNLFGPILLILLFTFPTYINLLRGGYFGTHDDIQIMRLFEMKKCVQDLQLPCRWVPDMGAGYGHPLFNYYPVLPYYFGMIFRLVGVSLIDTSKILFLLSLVLSGLFMYMFTREFFGKVAGVVAAVLYMYAPYHAVDIYVRGALSESWGMVFFPIILWSLYKLITQKTFNYLILSALSFAGLLLAHNATALLFGPVIVGWVVFWLWRRQQFSPKPFLALLWGLGLSSFFVWPSILETNLLNISLAKGYFNFHDHFVYLDQLFLKRTWGYGPSIAGSNDDLAFQIGWPHWWLAVGAILLIALLLKKRNVSRRRVVESSIFGGLLWIWGIWMTTSASVWVWERVPLIAFVQFPWRFLAIIIFANAWLVGILIALLKRRVKWLVAVLIIVAAISFNFSYFQFNRYYPDYHDTEMLSGGNWTRQSMSTLEDFVPKNVNSLPVSLAPNSPIITDGLGQASNYILKSNSWSFTTEITSSKAQVKVPVFYYPGWEVKVDGKVSALVDDRDRGLITLELPKGRYQIQGKFLNTPLRELANIISLVSLAILGWSLFKWLKTGRINQSI